MKKWVVLLLIPLAMNSCSVTSFSAGGTKEKQFVAKFLGYMDHSKTPPAELMMNCLSRKYLTEHKIDQKKYKVNYYTIWGYSIESYSSSGRISAKIWGENRSWMHQLTFQLTKENGSLYLQPKSREDDYIDPWQEVKDDIEQ